MESSDYHASPIVSGFPMRPLLPRFAPKWQEKYPSRSPRRRNSTPSSILDYTQNPARHSSGPIIAGGKVVSGRSCMLRGGPETPDRIPL